MIKTQEQTINGLLNDCSSKHIFLLVHGFGANKKTKQFNEIEYMLNSHNISTLRIDQYGHGDNKDQFIDLTVTKAIETVESCIDYLQKKDYKNIGILGSSFGGLTSFFATLKNSQVSILVLKSPACKLQGDLILKFKDINLEKWKNEGVTNLSDKSGVHQLLVGVRLKVAPRLKAQSETLSKLPGKHSSVMSEQYLSSRYTGIWKIIRTNISSL
jgi:alpha-beta hydrolase superfamily lysophospholipase